MEKEERKQFEGMEKPEGESIKQESPFGGEIEGEEESTFTLQSLDGDEVEFSLVATIYLYDDTYLIAHPNNVEGVQEDEAMVLKIKQEGDEISYSIEEDQDVIMMVFQEYYSLYEEANKEEEGGQGE